MRSACGPWIIDGGKALRKAIVQDFGADVKVSLDDFGNGFSKLSQFARAPLDELKIDRSLTGDARRSETMFTCRVGIARRL